MIFFSFSHFAATTPIFDIFQQIIRTRISARIHYFQVYIFFRQILRNSFSTLQLISIMRMVNKKLFLFRLQVYLKIKQRNKKECAQNFTRFRVKITNDFCKKISLTLFLL